MHLITKLTEVMVRNWPLAKGSGRMVEGPRAQRRLPVR